MELPEFIRIHQKVEVAEYRNTVPDKPAVSVTVLIYNHEKYIRECLDSILSQECDFPFEVLLGEDGSVDSSREICIEYAEKYPEQIRLLLHDRANVVKIKGAPTGRFNIVYCFNQCRGKYIAIMDGDDFWTDPKKLQKQFNFMEDKTDFSLCFHPALNLFIEHPQKNFIHVPRQLPRNHQFTPKDVILGGGGFITTASMFFKSEYIREIPDWFFEAPVGDFPSALILSVRGKIGYMDEVMCTYRRRVLNSWDTSMNLKKRKKHVIATKRMLQQFNRWSNYKYNKWIKIKILKNYYTHLKRILKHQLISRT